MPWSVSSWRDSNWGLTSPKNTLADAPSLAGRDKRAKAGASTASPMKLTSHTIKSNGAPNSPGSASLMFVRSKTLTRSSVRIFQASWP